MFPGFFISFTKIEIAQMAFLSFTRFLKKKTGVSQADIRTKESQRVKMYMVLGNLYNLDIHGIDTKIVLK